MNNELDYRVFDARPADSDAAWDMVGAPRCTTLDEIETWARKEALDYGDYAPGDTLWYQTYDGNGTHDYNITI